MIPLLCPQCSDPAAFSKKRGRYFCAECELEFDAPSRAVEPQTIFLSYAHLSEREEDFDVSEELVLLIQSELQRDGHTVWIDKDGIRAGSQWRERITAAILEHAHFLSFLSTRSVRDPGVCLNEIATALGASKNIQTVLAQDERQVAPPLTISHIQWHDFQHWREIRAGTKTGPMGENWDAWFGQRMAGVRESLTNAQNARVNGELQKLRDILDPRSFEARIVEKTTNFHGRQWLFDAAQDWLDNSTSRMFWLKGSPGVGKSAFAAKLAHQARSAVIGFFMCDFQGRKDPEESAREAICTLAFQIASRLPDFRLKLLYEKQLDKDKVEKRTADDLFEFLITEPLSRSGKIPESTRLCLVIDALDEAGHSGGVNALAELLVKHAERLPEWLGVLVTSRPEPYLEQMLKTLSGTAVDGQSAHNLQDLAEWIDQRLPEEIEGDDRQQLIDAVIAKSGGTFLYLSLVEADKTLSLAAAKKLPDKLDGFFKQTFDRYFPDLDRYGKKVEPFLRLMVAAPGPLPEEMCRQILGWSKRDLNLNVIEQIGSLLLEQEGGLVFFHASLADWVQDRKRSGRYCVEERGVRLLGEFIWRQLEFSEATQWTEQIADWLAILLPHIPAWNSFGDLQLAKEFFEEHFRLRDVVAVSKRELALLKSKHGEFSFEVAESLHLLAISQSLIGEGSNALDNLHRAQRIYAGHYSKNVERVDWARAFTWVCHALGDVLNAQGLPSEALTEYQKGLEMSKHLTSLDSGNEEYLFDLAVSHNRIGNILEAKGDLSGALVTQCEYQSIFEYLSAQQLDRFDWQSHYAHSCSIVGHILQKHGDLDKSLSDFNKAVHITKRLVSDRPKDTDFQAQLAHYHVQVGGALEMQGDLDGALAEFYEAMRIGEHLVKQSPENLEWRRYLGVSFNRIGGVLEERGDLEGALDGQRRYQAIFEGLVTEDPGNTVWLNSTAISCSRIGRILELQGDLDGALFEQQKNQRIFEQLTLIDPENTDWLEGLGISHNRICSILHAGGDLGGAIEHLRYDREIAVRLVEKDPANVFWQSNLATSRGWLGHLLEARGDFEGSINEFREASVILDRLIEIIPKNLNWLQQISTCHFRIGELLYAKGDLPGALQSFEKDLLISEQLALLQAHDEQVLRDLALTQALTSSVALSLGFVDLAFALHSKAEQAVGKLSQNNDRSWELDPLVIAALGAEIGAVLHDNVAITRFHDTLRELEVLPNVQVGKIGKRFVRSILKQLFFVAERCDLCKCALITTRALRLVAAGGDPSDSVPWRAKASQLLSELEVGSSLAIDLSAALALGSAS